MIEVAADRISAKDTENKEFLSGITKYGGQIIVSALVLGAVILGVNVKGVKIPDDKDIKTFLYFTKKLNRTFIPNNDC